MNKKQTIRELTQDKDAWTKISRNMLLGVSGLFLFVCFMPWMQSVPAEGRVVALSAQERRQTLSAPVNGRIHKWFVSEGSFVKKGDSILEIMDNDPLILNRMEKERDALQKKFEAIELGRQTAAINVKRQRSLFDQGLSSRRQYEIAKMELAKLESEEANALADMSRIDVRVSRQEQQKINAPIDGTVVRILKNAAEGVEYIHAGEPLAILVPKTESRIVEMWVSGNDMPWVEVGKRVALQFEGWPAILFSGVPGMSVGTFFGKVYLVDVLDDGYGRFRVLVIPEDDSQWPSPSYLKQGVRTYAWVLLNEVPLIYELWRRFNGFPPSNLPVYTQEKLDKMEKAEESDAGSDKK
jgi:multidrug resistance efflux pump